jgi:hypothetical protein
MREMDWFFKYTDYPNILKKSRKMERRYSYEYQDYSSLSKYYHHIYYANDNLNFNSYDESSDSYDSYDDYYDYDDYDDYDDQKIDAKTETKNVGKYDCYYSEKIMALCKWIDDGRRGNISPPEHMAHLIECAEKTIQKYLSSMANYKKKENTKNTKNTKNQK